MQSSSTQVESRARGASAALLCALLMGLSPAGRAAEGTAAEGGGALTEPERVVFGEVGSRFGAWLALVPDLDGDGIEEIVCGERGEDGSALWLLLSWDLRAATEDLAVGEVAASWVHLQDPILSARFDEASARLELLAEGLRIALLPEDLLDLWDQPVEELPHERIASTESTEGSEPEPDPDGPPACAMLAVHDSESVEVCGAPDLDELQFGRVAPGSDETVAGSGPAAASSSDGSDSGFRHQRPFGLSSDGSEAWLAWLSGEIGPLANAHPGAQLGLEMRWTSLSRSTLDGESVDEILPGAAGDELVVDGRYVHSVPLALPDSSSTARPPRLAVRFIRGRDDGPLGLHWTLAPPAIERRGPFGGTPTGTDEDRYFLDGRELIAPPISATVPGTAIFVPKDGGNESILHDLVDEIWTVTRPGSTQEFGRIPDTCGTPAPETGPPLPVPGAPATVTFRWPLCRERDAFDNATLYVYDGLARPLHVAWGEPAEPGSFPDPGLHWSLRTHRLDFAYDVERPPVYRPSASGPRLHETMLGSVVHRVSPTGSGHEVERSWAFLYETLQPSGRKLLHEIRLLGAPGADGVVRAEERLRQFQYRNDAGKGDFDSAGLAWAPATDVSAQLPSGADGWRMRPARLNHDALPDLVFLRPHADWDDGSPPLCDTQCASAPSNACFAAVPLDCLDPTDAGFAQTCENPLEIRTFVNVGQFQFQEDALAAAVLQSHLDQQDPFAGEESFSDVESFLSRLHFVDLTGDGMDEFVGPDSTLLSPPGADWRALAGWLFTPQGHPPAVDFNLSDQTPIWTDLDGDGRTDLVLPPTKDRVEHVPNDGLSPGGLCIGPPEGGFVAKLNRSPADALEFVTLAASDFGVPFFSYGPHFEQLIPQNLAAPIGAATGMGGLLSCTLSTGAPGYLVSDAVLATLDFDEASLAAATSGLGYLAQQLQFTEANGDGCADVLVAMETHPLKAISALRPGWADFEEVPDFFDEIFLGDCRGGFLPSGPDASGVRLGWPSTRFRSRPWQPDAQVSCGQAPLNGIALSLSCDEPERQPWAMRQCQPQPGCSACCGSCGGAYEVCEGFDCGNCPGWSGGEPPSEDELAPVEPYEGPLAAPWQTPSSDPACTTDFDPYISSGEPEPWDPMLRHRFARGLGSRRAGGSLSGTLGGQLLDVDGDGRAEWLQGCARQGFADPQAPGWTAPGASAIDVAAESAGYPLAAVYRGSDTAVLGPGVSCEANSARASGVEFLGAMAWDAPVRTTRPASLGRDIATLLMDLNGDGFVDELSSDGLGGVFVRAQARLAPEHSLEAVTYPWGEYPEASAFLAWRAGNPLENPNLPFPDLDIAEVVDGNGHRVWARAQCRMEDGDFVGCGIVAEQDHRGSLRKSLHATRSELVGFQWLSSRYDAAGRLAELGISLPAGSGLSGLDEEAPFWNPSGRDCAYAISKEPFDPSLQSYVTACVEHASPWMASGTADLGELWEEVGQVAFAWPYAEGLLGHGIALFGQPANVAPQAPGFFELFVSGTEFDPWLQVPVVVHDERSTRTVDDDLRIERGWDSVAGQARPASVLVSSPVTGEIFRHEETSWDGWAPIGTTRWGGSEALTATSSFDAFGRTLSLSNPAGATSWQSWNACGVERGTDALGNWSERGYDALCRGVSRTSSSGGGESFVYDGLGLLTLRTADPDTGDPDLSSWSAVDRDPLGYGDPARPQEAATDGRSLSLVFRDHRGRPARTRICALAAMPADPGDAAAWACVPGTEIDWISMTYEDGLPFAASGPQIPGEPAVFSLQAQDSLGRLTQSWRALGTEAQVLGLSPGLELGPPTSFNRDWDRQITVLPGGLLAESIRDPLGSRDYLGGQLVAQVASAPDGALLSATDAMARVSTYGYDAFRRREASGPPGFLGVDEGGAETWLSPSSSLDFDAAGRLASATDARGYAWGLGWDALGRPTQAWDPDGLAISSLVYDDAQRRQSLLDADGDAVTTTRDALGRVVQVAYADGTSEALSYDAFGSAASRTDRRGASTGTSRDFLPGGRQRLATSYADGSEEVAFLDPRGLPLRSVDRDGVARDFEYDGWGRLLRERLGAATPLDLASWPSGEILAEHGWDPLSRRAWTCPGGLASGLRCEGFLYDLRGRLVTRHIGLLAANLDDPALWASLGSWSYGYREDDTLDHATDPLGQVHSLVYDEAGHLRERLVDGQSLGTTLYNLAGEPVREQHPDGSLTDLVLDARGRLIERWEPGHSSPRSFGYWPDGALQWEEDGDGFANGSLPVPADRWLDYDAAGRVVAETGWNGFTIESEYLGVDLVATTELGADGAVLARSDYAWDPVDGRLLGTATALTADCAAAAYTAGSMELACSPDAVASSAMDWSPAGRRLSVTDGEGHLTAWTWDSATGRLHAREAESSRSEYVYGAAGRIARVLQGPAASPALQLDVFYDTLGAVREQSWREFATGAAFSRKALHDVLGRTIWAEARQDGHVTEEQYLEHDALGRVLRITQGLGGMPGPGVPWNGACDPGELCFDFDAALRPAATSYPDGRQVAFEWSGPQLDRVCEGPSCALGSEIFEVLARDDLGRPTETWRAGDVYESTSFDAGGRPDLQEIEYQNVFGVPGGGGTLLLVDPEYDGAGRLLSRAVEQFGSGPFPDWDEERSFTYNAAGWLASETLDGAGTAFSWDRARNRTGVLDLASGDSTLAAYGADNRLESLENLDAAGNVAGSVGFGYDDLGRRLNDAAGNTLSYAAHGRLAEIHDPAGALLAEWSFGAHGGRVSEWTAAGGDRAFLFAPGTTMPQVVTGSAGAQDLVQVAGAHVATLGPGAGPERTSLVASALAQAPSLVSDLSGELRWQGSWDPWGLPRDAHGAAPPVSWQGLLPSGGGIPFLSAHFRDYDPSAGTWLQQDPLGVDGGLNVYGYADGDPVNLSDPLGLCTRELSLEAIRERAWPMLQAAMAQGGLEFKGGARVPLYPKGWCDLDCFQGLVDQAAFAGDVNPLLSEALVDPGPFLPTAAERGLRKALRELGKTLREYEAASARAGLPLGADLARAWTVADGLRLVDVFTAAYESGSWAPTRANFLEWMELASGPAYPEQLAWNDHGARTADSLSDAVMAIPGVRIQPGQRLRWGDSNGDELLGEVGSEALTPEVDNLFRGEGGNVVPRCQSLDCFAAAFRAGYAGWHDWRDFGLEARPPVAALGGALSRNDPEGGPRYSDLDLLGAGPAAFLASAWEAEADLRGLPGTIARAAFGEDSRLAALADWATGAGRSRAKADAVRDANWRASGVDPQTQQTLGAIEMAVVTQALGEIAAARGAGVGLGDDAFRGGDGSDLTVGIEAAGNHLQAAAEARIFLEYGERILETQSQRGAALRGIDFASIAGSGADARIILNEVTAKVGRVRIGQFSSLGYGRGGMRVFQQNLKVVRSRLGAAGLDDATYRELISQLDRSDFHVRFVVIDGADLRSRQQPCRACQAPLPREHPRATIMGPPLLQSDGGGGWGGRR